MRSHFSSSSRPVNREPRWPALLAVLAVSGLYLSLPERLTPGPNWVVALAIWLLLIPVAVAHRFGKTRLNMIFGIVMLLVITAAVIWSLVILVSGLPHNRQPPVDLLRSAVALWASNLLLFASWYWRLDAGGPHVRDSRDSHTDGAFLFPQLTLPPNSGFKSSNWKPGFVDYLFLAFNTSTAFSPTDVPVLSRWAKVLTMVQSSVSLSTVAVLGARAVNIL